MRYMYILFALGLIANAKQMRSLVEYGTMGGGMQMVGFLFSKGKFLLDGLRMT